VNKAPDKPKCTFFTWDRLTLRKLIFWGRYLE